VGQDTPGKIDNLKPRSELLCGLTIKFNEEAPDLEGIALKAVALKCSFFGIHVGDGSMAFSGGLEMLGAVRDVRADLKQ
jgi:hypothetical protein